MFEQEFKEFLAFSGLSQHAQTFYELGLDHCSHGRLQFERFQTSRSNLFETPVSFSQARKKNQTALLDFHYMCISINNALNCFRQVTKDAGLEEQDAVATSLKSGLLKDYIDARNTFEHFNGILEGGALKSVLENGAERTIHFGIDWKAEFVRSGRHKWSFAKRDIEEVFTCLESLASSIRQKADELALEALKGFN